MKSGERVRLYIGLPLTVLGLACAWFHIGGVKGTYAGIGALALGLIVMANTPPQKL